MHFSLEETIPFHRVQVFAAQRDHLPELAAYLSDIEEIVVESRSESGSVVELVNLWKATGGDIPTAARAFVKPELLRWTDYASWDSSTSVCTWKIVLGFLPDAIHCEGTTSFKEEGEHTKVTIAGEIRIDAAKIPGVPRFAAGKIGDIIEKFVVNTIKPNLSKTNEGVTAFLRDQQKADNS